MKKEQKISIFSVLLLGMFLVFTSSCKKDDESTNDVTTDEETTIEVSYGTMTDQEGNVYKTVTIGTQTCMAENLCTTTYNDGSEIPYITDRDEWINLIKGAYCAYSRVYYGCLYNWYAVNTGKLAPEGWHIPTVEEWTQLTDYLGGVEIAGGILKEVGTAHWYSPNTSASNKVGFNALPGGMCMGSDVYSVGEQGFWWCVRPDEFRVVSCMKMFCDERYAYPGAEADKEMGMSVRCICDETIEGSATDSSGSDEGNETVTYGTMTDQDGNVYKTLTIGTQTWMAENLRTTKYSDDTIIPNVTENDKWEYLTTAAYCNYNNTSSTDTIETYGRLYNWYAVNTGKLAPEGWHVATNEDWNTLATALGGVNVAGGKLKETGTAHWNSQSTGVTNEISFTALPGGYRKTEAVFVQIGYDGYWWCPDEYYGIYNTKHTNIHARNRAVTYNSSVLISSYNYKSEGYSVRCVKD